MRLKFLIDHQRRIKKLQELQNIIEDDVNAFIIHYACEEFNKTDGTSPRITAIAIMNLKTHQFKLFSIHEEAELISLDPANKIRTDCGLLEFSMLQNFYAFVTPHRHKKWIHWGMKNDTYGFQAIKKRYKILHNQLKPDEPFSEDSFPEIEDENLFDLSLSLKLIYGENYVPRENRMAELVVKNKLNNPELLSGKAEPECWTRGEYLKINRSISSKVTVFEQIIRKIEDGSLKTDSNWFAYTMNAISSNPIVQLLIIFSAFVGLILGLIQLVKLIHS